MHVNGSGNSLIVKNIGTIKTDHWKFEKEYRFLALANHEWDSNTNSFEIKKAPYNSEVVAKYLDIEIDENILSKMEVKLGPCCEESERIIVSSLIKTYTKHGVVSESELKGKIKC